MPNNKLNDFNRMTGLQQMRTMVRAFANCRESFLDQFTLTQAEMIYRMWISSEWDFLPDTWTERQVKEALAGVTPAWLEEGNPFYLPETKKEYF